jgi:nucleolar protein 15
MARVTRSKTAKTEKVSKPVSTKKSIDSKKSVQLKKDLQKDDDNKEVENDFQLPSDSDESDDEEFNKDESNLGNQDKNENENENEKSLEIHNDIITNDKNSNSKTSISNKSGHTIIKSSNSKNNSNNNSSNLKSSGSKRGVIYIGRLPSGFEEKELKKYFQQFGDITRLRLSRNKKTGKSKHYAFIEFKDFEVAKIAAETMNNYLLMGHLLKVSTLTDDKIHENLFIGANTKFKIIPYSKINQAKFEKKRSVEDWEKINENHKKNLKNKQESLSSMGIDYNINDL